MSFKVFYVNNNDDEKNNSPLNNSYISQTSKFTIQLFDNDFWTHMWNLKSNESEWYESGNIHGFTAISLEPFSYGISTNWKDGAGIKMVDLIQKFTRVSDGTCNLATMFAAGNYNANVATDSLTQEHVVDGAPLTVSLKFRVFNENFKQNSIIGRSYTYDDETKGWKDTNSVNQSKIIKFLTHVTSPATTFNWTDELANLGAGWANAKRVFSEDSDYVVCPVCHGHKCVTYAQVKQDGMNNAKVTKHIDELYKEKLETWKKDEKTKDLIEKAGTAEKIKDMILVTCYRCVDNGAWVNNLGKGSFNRYGARGHSI